MGEKFSIRLNILDRFYPLKVNPNEEENIRKAAKMINERVLLYKQKYSTKDIQDFLAMTALQLGTKLLDNETKQ